MDLALDNLKKKPFRLALIASEHTLWEYSIFLKYLLVGLADESVPVVLVCPPGSDVDSLFTGPAEIIKYPVFELPLTDFLNRRLLIEELVKFKPTILHCLCESRALLTKRIARKLDLPYVLMVNSYLKSLSRFSFSSRYCAKIITPAPSIADDIAEIYPRFTRRIEQINISTFVNEDNICFSNASCPPTIVMACPLDDVDDFENVFKAVRHLVIEGYEFMMVVTGSGRAEGQLRELIAALDLSQTVVVLPKLRPWWSVLATGDIFIQPQPNSAFDPLLLESMSAGLAVAACKGGVDDLIIEDKTAVIFDPDDELSIVGALQLLLDKREFAREIAKNAQQHLKNNHTVSKMISSFFQVYYEAQQWLK
jgi:glycosyltransferase involved in cell wall biosynthesis